MIAPGIDEAAARTRPTTACTECSGALALVERLEAGEHDALVRRRAAEAEAHDREDAEDVRLRHQDLLGLPGDLAPVYCSDEPAGACTWVRK